MKIKNIQICRDVLMNDNILKLYTEHRLNNKWFNSDMVNIGVLYGSCNGASPFYYAQYLSQLLPFQAACNFETCHSTFSSSDV